MLIPLDDLLRTPGKKLTALGTIFDQIGSMLSNIAVDGYLLTKVEL